MSDFMLTCPCYALTKMQAEYIQKINKLKAELAALRADDGWIDRRVQKPPVFNMIDVWDDDNDNPKRTDFDGSHTYYRDINGVYITIKFRFWRHIPGRPKALEV